MNWIKWIIYLLCYGTLLIAFFPIVQNFVQVASALQETQLVGELHRLANLVVEGVLVIILGVLFFLPIKGDNGKLTSSINYFADNVAEGIETVFFNVKNLSDSEKRIKYMSIGYNVLLLLIITVIYFYIIKSTNQISNGLKVLFYCFTIGIVTFVVNALTSVIAKMESGADAANSSISSKDALIRKNVLIFIFFFFLLVFLSKGDLIALGLYNWTHEAFPFSLFDGSRSTIDAASSSI